jgi:hypothetical protein
MISFRSIGVGLSVLGALWGASACQVADEATGAGEEAATVDTGPSLYRPGNRFAGWSGDTLHDDYLDKVQPILAKRCVTCHGCTTSPCQLKLTAYEGVQRGSNPTNFFGTTIFSSPTGPTRLKDGITKEDWRAKGFYSVLDGGRDSIMFKMLEHGNNDNKAGFNLANAYDVYKGKAEKLDFQCLDTRKEADARLAKAGTGMPLGAPALAPADYATLTDWIVSGAKGPSPEAQRVLAAPRDEAMVARWEEFFNQSSPKARLSMRYLFEHLSFGKLHFDDSAKSRGDYFELVRSRTRTGAIDEVVTETPAGDPKVSFHYRLKKHTQIITAKDNIVFHLDEKVKRRWTDLFLTSAWDPGVVPGYEETNPFKYFEKIPGTIRYKFMLENSQRLIDAMVKGDVCNGSAATYAIRDRFLTLFLKPESDPSAIDPKLGQETFFHLDPNSGSIFRDVDFEMLFERELRKLRPQGLSEKDLWDGGKTDKNAWVTVFRHGSNASAHYGPMGQFPETMWVLDYGNFERLFYDLVVLYRPWGAVPHKLSTWRQMSHVRSHAEDLFLMFLPEAMRDPLRLQFTPGWGRFTEIDMAGTGYPSALANIDPKRPAEDFVSRVRRYLGPEIAGPTTLDPDPMTAHAPAPASPRTKEEMEAALFELTLDRGNFSNDLPDITWLTVDAGDQTYEYTLLANRIFWHNSRILGDSLSGMTRRPELDSISVTRGHVGAFPQLFLRVPVDQVAATVRLARGGPDQRRTIRAKFEIKRNSHDFWRFLDDAHDSMMKADPIGAGIIDTSRYLWPREHQADASGFDN